MPDLTTLFHHLQRQLFPALESELGTLFPLDRQFCEVISLTDLGRFTRACPWCGNGCPPCPRVWLAHAFIAKSVYQFPTTGAPGGACRQGRKTGVLGVAAAVFMASPRNPSATGMPITEVLKDPPLCIAFL